VPANLLANVLFNKFVDKRVGGIRTLLKDAKMPFVLRFRSFLISEIIDICLSRGTLFPSSTSSSHVNRWLSKWFFQDPEKPEQPVKVEPSQNSQVESPPVTNENGKRPASSSPSKPKKKKRKIIVIDDLPQSYRAKTRTTLESSIIANIPLLISIVSHLVFKDAISIAKPEKYFEQFARSDPNEKNYALLKKGSTKVNFSFALSETEEEFNLCSLLEIMSCGNRFESISEEKDTKAYSSFLEKCANEFKDLHSLLSSKGNKLKLQETSFEKCDLYFLNYFSELLNCHHSPNFNMLLNSETQENNKKRNEYGYDVRVPRLFNEKFKNLREQTKNGAIKVLKEITEECHSKFLFVETILHQTKKIFQEQSTTTFDPDAIINIVTKKTLANYKNLDPAMKDFLSTTFAEGYKRRHCQQDLGYLLSDPLRCDVKSNKEYKGIEFEEYEFWDDLNYDPNTGDIVDDEVHDDEVTVVSRCDGGIEPFYSNIVRRTGNFQNFQCFFLFVAFHHPELLSQRIHHVPIFELFEAKSSWFLDGTVEFFQNVTDSNTLILENVVNLISIRKNLLHILKIGNCLLVHREADDLEVVMSVEENFALIYNCSRYMHTCIRHLERHLMLFIDTLLVSDESSLAKFHDIFIQTKVSGRNLSIDSIKDFFDHFCPKKLLTLVLNGESSSSIYELELKEDAISFPCFVRKHADHCCCTLDGYFSKIRDSFKTVFVSYFNDNHFDLEGQPETSLIVNKALNNIDVLRKAFRKMTDVIQDEANRHPNIIENCDVSPNFADENSQGIGGSFWAPLVLYQTIYFVAKEITDNSLFGKVDETYLDVFSEETPPQDFIEQGK